MIFLVVYLFGDAATNFFKTLRAGDIVGAWEPTPFDRDEDYNREIHFDSDGTYTVLEWVKGDVPKKPQMALGVQLGLSEEDLADNPKMLGVTGKALEGNYLIRGGKIFFQNKGGILFSRSPNFMGEGSGKDLIGQIYRYSGRQRQGGSEFEDMPVGVLFYRVTEKGAKLEIALDPDFLSLVVLTRSKDPLEAPDTNKSRTK